MVQAPQANPAANRPIRQAWRRDDRASPARTPDSGSMPRGSMPLFVGMFPEQGQRPRVVLGHPQAPGVNASQGEFGSRQALRRGAGEVSQNAWVVARQLALHSLIVQPLQRELRRLAERGGFADQRGDRLCQATLSK